MIHILKPVNVFIYTLGHDFRHQTMMQLGCCYPAVKISMHKIEQFSPALPQSQPICIQPMLKCLREQVPVSCLVLPWAKLNCAVLGCINSQYNKFDLKLFMCVIFFSAPFSIISVHWRRFRWSCDILEFPITICLTLITWLQGLAL